MVLEEKHEALLKRFYQSSSDNDDIITLFSVKQKLVTKVARHLEKNDLTSLISEFKSETEIHIA